MRVPEIDTKPRERTTHVPSKLAFTGLVRAVASNSVSGYRWMISSQTSSSFEAEVENIGIDGTHTDVRACVRVSLDGNDDATKFQWIWQWAESRNGRQVDSVISASDRWIEKAIDALWHKKSR